MKKNLGSFNSIGNLSVGKAAHDLSLSVNLLSSSILRNNGGVQVNPSNVTPKRSHKIIKHPLGVVEDVMVEANKTFVTS
jgi:hypothetical protein